MFHSNKLLELLSKVPRDQLAYLISDSSVKHVFSFSGVTCLYYAPFHSSSLASHMLPVTRY